MKGQCLCRRVTVETEAAPAFINICNCNLCRKLGAAWGYYSESAVAVNGETGAYRRDDLDHEPWCEEHFCPACGSATHFLVIHPEHEGIGVNMRLFDQDELEGITVNYFDTRARRQPGDEAEQTATGHIGDGRAF